MPSAVLLLVGGAEPEYQRRLERLARELGVGDAVVFAGRVPFDQIEAMYRLIDVFLVTRPDQPVTRLVTPLKPLEALAAGLAVVASRLEALEELLGGQPERGALYRADDLDDLAETILRLVRDPSRRAALGRNGRVWVEAERSWARLVQRYLAVYRDLVR